MYYSSIKTANHLQSLKNPLATQIDWFAFTICHMLPQQRTIDWTVCVQNVEFKDDVPHRDASIVCPVLMYSNCSPDGFVCKTQFSEVDMEHVIGNNCPEHTAHNVCCGIVPIVAASEDYVYKLRC